MTTSNKQEETQKISSSSSNAIVNIANDGAGELLESYIKYRQTLTLTLTLSVTASVCMLIIFCVITYVYLGAVGSYEKELRILQLKQDETNVILASKGLIEPGDLFYGRAMNMIKKEKKLTPKEQETKK